MNTYVLCAIAISAVLTFLLRCLPFLIFSKERTMPKWLTGLGDKLPSAIMAVLIVYCLKNVPYDFVGTGISGLSATFVTALSYKMKHNTFLSILLGTATYMILLRI